MADELRNYILVLIIFTAFIVGGVSMFAELRKSKQGFPDDPKFEMFNDTFDIYSDLDTSIGQLEASITGANATFGAFGGLNALIVSSWNTIKLTFSSFGFIEDVLLGTHTIFGFPTWIAGLAFMAITVIISYTILRYIFRST